jgi:uncharacterized protein
VPFREFVLKIHSRCDLACDYCYMYTMADQSWRGRPMVMSQAIIEATAARIGEHVLAHELPSVGISLHGGEPLLAGPEFIGNAVSALRRALPPHAHAKIDIQTNGVRLDERFLDLFKRLGVRVGVSVDGAAAAHDRHRRRANGAGSYRRVAAAVRRLASPAYRGVFGGLLCVVDTANDPVATYDALADFAPPALDFLLPHGNWTAPPPGRVADSAATPYADWLIAVFDRWYGTEQGAPPVRLFTEIMHALLGGAAATEAIGLSPAADVVIETDGAIEQLDGLKSAYPGAPYTGGHVTADSFDSLLRSPWYAARQLGVAGLCAECRQCPVVQVCGGGHYVHRYRAGRGMLNPSVYCLDLLKLIAHIRSVMAPDVRALSRCADRRLAGRRPPARRGPGRSRTPGAARRPRRARRDAPHPASPAGASWRRPRTGPPCPDRRPRPGRAPGWPGRRASRDDPPRARRAAAAPHPRRVPRPRARRLARPGRSPG